VNDAWKRWTPGSVSRRDDHLDLGDGLLAYITLGTATGSIPGLTPADNTYLLREKVLPYLLNLQQHNDAGKKGLVLLSHEVETLKKELAHRTQKLQEYQAREAELSFREGVAQELAPGMEVYLVSYGWKVRLDHKHRWRDDVSDTMIEGWTVWNPAAREHFNVPNSDISVQPVQAGGDPIPTSRVNYWLLAGLMTAISAATVAAHLAIHFHWIKVPFLSH